MTRRMILPLFFATLWAAPLSAQAPADPGKPKDESAETVDGVKLSCRFYQAQGEGNGSVVIMVHDLNADPKKGDWDGLARTIATKGFNVMRFDFRGHGDSKEIIPDKFWKDNRNQNLVTGNGRNPPKSTIEVKDFRQGYVTTLISDLAAVRCALDLKNDDKKVNTRSIYIIASGSAAPIVQAFIATEWHRPQIKPAPIGLTGTIVLDTVSANSRRMNGTEVAGVDYAGLIYLSPTRNYTYPQGTSVGKASFGDQNLRDWVSRYSRDSQGGAELRRSTSLLVLYGDKDPDNMPAPKEAGFFYNDLMSADGKKSPVLEPMRNSKFIPIKNAKEKGVDLLGKNNSYKTEDYIVAFLEKVEGDRKRLNPIDRKYDKPFKINWNSFNLGG
ncbi:hypothetical protein BH11PLA2_BH11PLA2_08610 [soil metagenome]